MERKTFLEHYRISGDYSGSAPEVGRVGPALIYKASDLRSGAPVALTLIPVASVDPAARESFEEQARVSQSLDHINIAKTHDFGIVDEHFVLVSEYPQGETAEAWIAAHGPMPPDAVLRIALQVVSALKAGIFYGLTHPAIQPSNLMIVPGGTAEGGWPHVKLLDFGLAGLRLAPSAAGEQAVLSEFASPEQLKLGTADFRSAIYSLGATLCFLLTGAFYSAEPRSRQTRRFTRPLRNLITPMLRQNPDERPQDPVLFTEAVRACLPKVERRQALAQKLGIPFVAVKAKAVKKQRPRRAPISLLQPAVMGAPAPVVAPVGAEAPIPAARRTWFLGRAFAVIALLLLVATAAAFLLPAPVSMILHRNRDKEALGVPVGIPERAAMAMAQDTEPSQPITSAMPLQSPATHAALSPPPEATASPAIAHAPQTLPAAQPGEQAGSATSPAAAPTPQPAPAAANQSVAQASSVANPSPASDQQNPPDVGLRTQSQATEISPPPSPPVVANAPSPAPPADGPQTVWERETGVKQKIASGNPEKEADASSPPAAEQGETSKKATGNSATASSKARSRSREVASNTRRSTSRRYEAPRRAEPVPDDEGEFRAPYQPYQGDQSPRVRRALPERSFRARVVGTTPEGDLILRLPSGEIAIAPAHRRPRRVIIERQPYFVPPRSEFVPQFPPDA